MLMMLSFCKSSRNSHGAECIALFDMLPATAQEHIPEGFYYPDDMLPFHEQLPLLQLFLQLLQWFFVQNRK